ncbi:radical SAM family heme chaperone HemW [Gemmatimonas groenlandica]|uniref:Heme chaperone HemW n=1 Tax=Gemmatimonas groenlandica TaxID=2732249 RepID=A0A6M4IM66_9BACT|nr:radical SAM family heme chaperone HemW [Gemmatimonas groenlandica]QJR34889.1 radical SAM family heme chaperone HemW [Gemmatimonas groenlandica]
MSAAPATPVGYRHLYLHVPFCARRCNYCDFAIAVRKLVPWRAFADSVDAELRLRGAAESCDVLNTLYLGGGTPSRLGGEGIERLFETLRQHVRWDANAEVTLEANPEDVSPDAVAAWRRAGVNRVSLGVQSFDDRVLSWMHRVHDADAAVRAVDTLRDGGIDAMSLDLIFATPATLERDWSGDITRLLALAPDHISLYGLTIEPHTPLGRWQARGELEEAPEDLYERQFLESHERLRGAGFEHYEVSNFARPGRRARHNSAYWQNVPYLGIGPSAHGFDGSERRWNRAALVAWEAALSDGLDPMEGAETLTRPNREAEMVYLGLRTIDGLELRDGEEARVATWRRQGWIESVPGTAGSHIRCTASGWLRLDALAVDLTALRSRS